MPLAGASDATGSPPILHITHPADGDWFTSPALRVRGTATPQHHELLLDGKGFAKGTPQDMRLASGQLRFSPIKWWSDEFQGNDLDLDKWSVLRDGNILVQDGRLYVYYDEVRQLWPLLVTAGDVFPHGSEWTAEMTMSYPWHHDMIGPGGGGITYDTPNEVASHAAVNYTGDDDQVEAWVYANGTRVEMWPQIGLIYIGVVSLSHSHIGPGYQAFLDGHMIAEFDRPDEPRLFWFGSEHNLGLEGYPYATVCVESVCIWILSGSWTSPVYDMGGGIVLDHANVSWSTSHQGQTNVSLFARASTDGLVWSPWTDTRELPLTLDGRYVQYRVGVSMKGLRYPDATATVTNVTIGYEHPVTAVEARLDGGQWLPATGLPGWRADVTLEEDLNVLEVRAVDTAGNVNVATLHLTLDTIPPVGSLRLLPERTHTNDRNVTLLLNATDRYGVPWMYVSYHSDLRDAAKLPYSGMLDWRLEGGSGLNTVYVAFADAHGLMSEVYQASIRYDPYPPSGSITIEDGAEATDRSRVNLTLVYYDEAGIAKVELSNHRDFRTSRQLELGVKAVDDWELDQGVSGGRTVYMRLTDLAGNVRVVEDGIELWVPAPLGVVVINGGEAASAQRGLVLDITPPVTFEASRMQVGSDTMFTDGQWMQVASRVVWIISPGDGPRWVYVRFEDGRGFRTLPVGDEILLDTTPPVIIVTLDGGAKYTTDARVDASVSCEDLSDLQWMAWSEVDDPDDLERRPFTAEFQWTLSLKEGQRTLHVWVTDAMGHVGHGEASIWVATQAPFCTLQSVGGLYQNAPRRVPVEVEVTDAYGTVVSLQLWLDEPPPDDAPWQPWNATMEVPLPPGTADGKHFIHFRTRNALGLTSVVHQVKVVLDREDPTVARLRPSKGATITTWDPVVDLGLRANDTGGILSIHYRLDGGDWIELDSDEPSTTLRLDDFGEHTIDVRVVDLAGNEAVASTTFTVKDRAVGIMYAGILAAVIAIVVVLAIVLRRRGRAGSDPG